MGTRGHPRGVVLFVVLVVIALLTLAGLTFSEMMLCEREAVDLTVRQAQARALAESGVEAARSFLLMDQELQIEAGGHYDNPTQFQGMLLIDGQYPRERGRYTIVAPYFENGYYAGVRYGLEDESARINLNALVEADAIVQEDMQIDAGARQVLMILPGMTEDVADAILDWIDEDDEPREFGAEIETYSSLDPGYAPKNGPLDTIEELLLVRGVTPFLLFGVDANRNGAADANEPDPETIEGVDNSDGSMTSGWAAYLTVHSQESNLQADGQPKINLNQQDLKTLSTDLQQLFSQEEVNFIIALRQNEPYTGESPGTPSAPVQIDPSGQPKYDLKTLLDVVGAKVQVPANSGSGGGGGTSGSGSNRGGSSGSASGGTGTGTILASPFSEEPDAMAEYLPTLLDSCTLSDAKTLPGRVNINQASRTVLLAIPGMTEDVVEAIVGSRESDPLVADPSMQYETWILTQGIVDLEQMKAVMPFVCAKGSTYRVQAIGYYDEGGPAVRIEVILDASQTPASVVSWKDMTPLGRGYALDVLGVDTAGLATPSATQ